MEKQSELAKLIRDCIAASLETGEPTAREVSDTFIASNESLIRDIGFDLAVRQIRTMFSTDMKKVVEINSESAGQLSLDIEFDGVPPAISFAVIAEGKTEIRYIPISRATEWHISQYEDLLRQQITADSAKLVAVEKLHRALAPAFEANPGITVRDACVYSEGAVA